ncbi:13739_t:CDS:2 [Funneliformis mosseae]|uniref:13739_t:CDS:1 n=1 Tax=Funneliformis mosseae TaxID=27381 RepID=A0A9N9C2L5_FUNMO|nr:13739_t:CDS:2 [Funneliformis mosseae]
MTSNISQPLITEQPTTLLLSTPKPKPKPTTEKVVAKIVKVVRQHEIKHEIGVENMDKENNPSKKKWTWVDC